MNIDINDVAERVNTSITNCPVYDDFGEQTTWSNVHINNAGVTINGKELVAPETIIISISTTPATNLSLAEVTVKFAVGHLTIDPNYIEGKGFNARQDHTGEIEFIPGEKIELVTSKPLRIDAPAPQDKPLSPELQAIVERITDALKDSDGGELHEDETGELRLSLRRNTVRFN